LTVLAVSENNLSGTPPSCLYNITSPTILSMTENNFHGPLPLNMFHNLPNLQLFLIGANKFSGLIPTSLNSSSSIIYFDISQNYFVGKVPNLGRLKDLHALNLEENNLGNNSTKDLDQFFKSLTNCSKLYKASIYHNNFGGILSNSIGNLSIDLAFLYFGDNMISGKIPVELGRLVNLV
jgi:hypothetical protein